MVRGLLCLPAEHQERGGDNRRQASTPGKGECYKDDPSTPLSMGEQEEHWKRTTEWVSAGYPVFPPKLSERVGIPQEIIHYYIAGRPVDPIHNWSGSFCKCIILCSMSYYEGNRDFLLEYFGCLLMPVVTGLYYKLWYAQRQWEEASEPINIKSNTRQKTDNQTFQSFVLYLTWVNSIQ